MFDSTPAVKTQLMPSGALRLMLLAALVFVASVPTGSAAPPEFPSVAAWTGRTVVATPAGAWQRFEVIKTGGTNVLAYRESDDGGATWTGSHRCCDLPAGSWGGGAAMIDRRNELQLFFIRPRDGAGGKKPAVDRFLDLWHLHSTDGRTRWSQPRRIHAGYIGAISSAIQLKSGRIVMPFGDWVAGRERQAPTGAIETTVLYSDDDGETFRLSPSRLVAPVTDDYNGDKVGACEPAVVQLEDGRVLMFMRTQAGWLYQSISDDGIHWPSATPSDLHASTGPPALMKLRDGRIFLAWNNCAMPPKVGGQGVYGGRDALHAALADLKVTRWIGGREIYRDPTRNLEPPKRGDRGTAYPELLPRPDGRVAVIAGQGGRRALLLVDPAWLEERALQEDFSRGLDGWSVYKPFGPAIGWWRNRTQGAKLVDHPDQRGRRALHLGRADEKEPDGATWNFPCGEKGVLALRVRLNTGCTGASIALTDCFFDPTDGAGETRAMFLLPLGLAVKAAGVTLPSDQWTAIELRWDLLAQSASVKINGRNAPSLRLAHPTRTGISYLRLRSTAAAPDLAGWLVDSVQVSVERAP